MCSSATCTIESNHPSGGWFGPEICGKNYRALLQAHPVYVDPQSALAGAYMANFLSYRPLHWPADLPYPRAAEAGPYKQPSLVGAMHHLCQDLAIGLQLGWGGLLHKVRFYRDLHAPAHAGFLRRDRAHRAGHPGLGRGAPPRPRRTMAAVEAGPRPAPQPGRDRRHQPTPGGRAAADLSRGLPVDRLVPDGRAHVQRQRLHRAAGYAAASLLRARHGCGQARRRGGHLHPGLPVPQRDRLYPARRPRCRGARRDQPRLVPHAWRRRTG